MLLEPLYAVLPSHSVAAFLACHIHILEAKDLLKASNLLASLDAVFLTPFLASFVSAFSTAHNNNFYSPLVPVSYRAPYNRLDSYT